MSKKLQRRINVMKNKFEHMSKIQSWNTITMFCVMIFGFTAATLLKPAEEYSETENRTLAQMPDYGKFDIIGHFDLITKHCENRDFFDITSKEYLSAAFEAAEALSGKIPFFEINTGAIGRGYRTSPYPTVPIIKELKRLGFGAVITSDCHNKETIDCAFDLAAELLKECGFEEKYILTGSGFKAVAL
jgi:histidinol-phosphatase (PHP family)